ncbi:MAG: hypothetical protein KBT03_07690 [Bacteroidales bacterium]|nr:hypothetical protein [Candidatus Scybalousia scybalohippi]
MTEEVIKLKVSLASEGGMIEEEESDRQAFNNNRDLQKALGGWIFDAMDENTMLDAEVEIRIRGRD